MPERKTHWENIYREKSPLEVSWYQQDPALSLELIHRTQVDHDAAIIDVGGGASALVDRLLDEGYGNVAVLDVSAHALAHARQRLGDRANDVKWYEADVCEFSPPQRFSVWHDRAVFHFLTAAADRKKYVKALKSALMPGGQLIMMAFAIDGPKKCSGLDIVQYDENKLTAELGSEFEMLEAGFEIHRTPSGAEQKFMYFHLEKVGNS